MTAVASSNAPPADAAEDKPAMSTVANTSDVEAKEERPLTVSPDTDGFSSSEQQPQQQGETPTGGAAKPTIMTAALSSFGNGGAVAGDGPIILQYDVGFELTHEENLLFSSLEAAADFHFSRHDTADISSAGSSSSVGGYSSRRSSSAFGMSTTPMGSRNASMNSLSNLTSLPSSSSLGGSSENAAAEGTGNDDNEKNRGLGSEDVGPVIDDVKKLISGSNNAPVLRPTPRAKTEWWSESMVSVISNTASMPPPSLIGKPLDIRVAGGWVRDKLLGLGSDDIDVALDDASGVEFAHMVRNYLEYVEDCVQEAEKHPESADSNCSNVKYHHHRQHDPKYKIGVIAANPEQSKHLETATMKIFDLGIDFVNLRAEEKYLPNSRIPQVSKRFGTPLEDALRRDFTCNALFYNIRTKCIEDYTRRGLSDLRKGIIETPLDPRITFRDDPLRVLRAVRFVVRFDFVLAKDLREAAMSQEVHDALMVKVSRERVGSELEGMLTGKAAKPRAALLLLGDLGLSDSVFMMGNTLANVRGRIWFPPGDSSPLDLHRKNSNASKDNRHNEEQAQQQELTIPEQSKSNSPSGLECSSDLVVDGKIRDADFASPSIFLYEECSTSFECESLRLMGWKESQECLRLLPNVLDLYQQRISLMSMKTKVDSRILHISSFLLPFRDLTFQPRKKSNARSRVVSYAMLRDGIKFKNLDVEAMERLLDHLDSMRRLLRMTTSSKEKSEKSMRQDNNGEGGAGNEVPGKYSNSSLTRLEVGMTLRGIGDLWLTCLLLAIIVEMRMAEAGVTAADATCTTNPVTCESSVFSSTKQVLESGENLARYIADQNLDKWWKSPPLLNGKAILQMLELRRGGPVVGQYIEDQWKWMLLNPNGTKEDCEHHLKERKREREEEEGRRRRERGKMEHNEEDGEEQEENEKKKGSSKKKKKHKKKGR